MIVKHLQDSSSLKSYLVGLDKSFWLNESELLAVLQSLSSWGKKEELFKAGRGNRICAMILR